jgi:hypothetical protein
MHPSRWTAECSWTHRLAGPREKRRNVFMTRAALRALAVALLCVGVGQPVQAQGGFLKKLQESTRSIQKAGEKADTALSKAGQTADAVKCLASDTNCVEQNAEGQPPVVADSSGRAFPSPAGADTVPRHCDSGPRPPPDTDGP